MTDIDFDEMLKYLKNQYNNAVVRQPDYDRYDQPRSSESCPTSFAMAGRASIAQLAIAMVEVAGYIDEQGPKTLGIVLKENTPKLQ